jgi:hypothetical protein
MAKPTNAQIFWAKHDKKQREREEGTDCQKCGRRFDPDELDMVNIGDRGECYVCINWDEYPGSIVSCQMFPDSFYENGCQS